ncbi:MAG: amidohydrolase family protein [Cyclobacteriaceae bacterium]
MKKLLASLAVLLTINLYAQEIKVLTGATLINSNGSKPIEGAVIVIEGNIITEVGKDNKTKIPAGAEVIDLKGKYVIPGLIDAHVHFFQSGGLYTRPDALDLRSHTSYEEELRQIKERLPRTFARYLRAGVTGVADVGGPMLNFDIRKQANSTELAPRVVVAGPLISTVANPKLDIGDPPIVKVSSLNEVDQLVQRLADQKADLIKIWFIVSPQLNFEENLKLIQRTIDQAHEKGIRAAVHATQLETAKAAVRAGADVLVHSVDDVEVDKEFIKLLKKNNTIYTSSLSVLDGYQRAFAQQFDFTKVDFDIADPFFMGSLFDLKKIPTEDIPERAKLAMANPTKVITSANEEIELAMVNLKTLQDAGVTIATGTDAGNIGTLHASSMHQELNIMEDAGLSPEQILVNSTLNGAKLMGMVDKIGSIEVGKWADMVILNANPLLNTENYSSIYRVVKDGKVYSPGEILASTPEELVQRQVVAYNARDLEGFLSVYSKDVKLYSFPDKLILEGMEQMRERYAERFGSSPNLYVEIANRDIMGEYIVDYEKVQGITDGIVEAMAIYHVKDGLIDEVRFISK